MGIIVMVKVGDSTLVAPDYNCSVELSIIIMHAQDPVSNNQILAWQCMYVGAN